MKEIWTLWEREKKVTFPWFFDLLEGFNDLKPIVPFVDLESTFFKALHGEFKRRNICPEYIISADDFFKTKSVSELLEDNVYLSLLIFKPPGMEVIERIKVLKNFSHQLKFVVLARKDWNFENTYCSIPSFMRSRLYVDFPISLQSRDSFLSPVERIPVVESFRKKFPGFSLRSYCPNLFLYTESFNSNISHFSYSGKLNSKGKNLSLILNDFKEIERVMGLEKMIHHSDQVEILLTQTNEGTVLPLSVRLSERASCPSGEYLFQIYTKDSGKPVSEALVNNFLASRATGRYLMFLDNKMNGSFGDILDIIFKESFDEFEFLNSGKAMVFRRSDFLKMGGFDPLFTDKSLVWFDSLFRYSLLKQRSFNYKVKNSGSQWDMIIHKYACEEKFNFYPAKSDSQFLLKKEFGKKPEKTGISVYLKKTCQEDGFFEKYLKKILIYFFKKIKNLVFYRFYCFIFYLFYPFRKIYHFYEFQYEKHILGFHRDQSGS